MEGKTQIQSRLVRHWAFWMVSLGGLFYINYGIHAMNGDFNWREILTVTAIMLPYNMILTYWALYWLLPPALAGIYDRFVRCLILYLSGSWLLISLYRGYVLAPLLTGELRLIPNFQETIALLDWYIALVIVSLAIAIRLYRFWSYREQANQQLTRETLTVELQVLKAQIYPHFLFNTLNNLYALTLKQSPQASDMVLKLSDLLHYMIHECNRPIVPLAKEILFLTNYVALERLRYGQRLVVLESITADVGTIQIAPMLLIPFVENAFKHGSAQQTGLARIEWSLVMIGSEMIFKIENSKETVAPDSFSTPCGIGLANAQKRLTLLYPGAHTLIIRPNAERFAVELRIQLDRKDSLVNKHQSVLSSPY